MPIIDIIKSCGLIWWTEELRFQKGPGTANHHGYIVRFNHRLIYDDFRVYHSNLITMFSIYVSKKEKIICPRI